MQLDKLYLQLGNQWS